MEKKTIERTMLKTEANKVWAFNTDLTACFESINNFEDSKGYKINWDIFARLLMWFWTSDIQDSIE